MERLIYFLTRTVLFPLIRLLFINRVDGLARLPAQGALIIAANHSSYMDHFLLAALASGHRGRKLYFLTRQEAFEGYWSRVWHLATGCVPVDRANPEIASFRTMLELLQRGEIVVIYPEGTRSSDGTPLPPKPGVIRLALHAGVPVMPVGLRGSHHILPKGAVWPRMQRADVFMGELMDVSAQVAQPKSKEAVQVALHELMAEINRLAANGPLREESSLSTPSSAKATTAGGR